GGDDAGAESDRAEKDAGGHQREGMLRTDTIQKRRGSASGERSQQRTNSDAEESEAECLAQDDGNNIFPAGAEGHANADFRTAESDDIGDNAIETDHCQDQRKKAKRTRKQGEQALANHAVLNGFLKHNKFDINFRTRG